MKTIDLPANGMETGTTYQHRLSANLLAADEREVYRYAGYSKAALLNAEAITPETSALVSECIAAMRPVLRPQAVYAVFPLTVGGAATAFAAAAPGTAAGGSEICSFAGYTMKSACLAWNLAGCSRVILFAATIGPQVDFLIRKSAKLDAARGAVMQAAGAMFAESYADFLNAELSRLAVAGGFVLKPRYSPGYGDVPLDVQRVFFSILPCAQKIGLTLTSSLVMAPEKSVTAFIGMKRAESAT
ncbi:vitamin B12 dependent-methionine synthase activation domain-containing protein [Treponema brennaborense]|uniref:Vitamin B12 dependent methionine synthase activation region n=1 Tax=Treponema brennaborense (strain DSM 12168 / CIP 105900 / DD5/3) TaxID=906968 RepID=F4LNC4_TREBD|nr:vitamin B12 dependent-methionine synthase activation domain-containing protein [Treponema brennaborense]AEE17882.1 Vitamin B12 dependent methionine synthase activation region [Treponema brennaborense DSM 12168]